MDGTLLDFIKAKQGSFIYIAKFKVLYIGRERHLNGIQKQ